MKRHIRNSAFVRGALAAAVLCVALEVPASSQAQKEAAPTSGAAATAQPTSVETQKSDEATKQGAAQPAAMSPEEVRQAQILADTNKLYELAQELKAEVAKSNKDTLSLAVIKKAAEVEKLAKSLKERMRAQDAHQ